MDTDVTKFIEKVEHAVSSHNLGQRSNLTRLSFTLSKHKIPFLSIYDYPVLSTDVGCWILKKQLLLSLKDLGATWSVNFHNRCN